MDVNTRTRYDQYDLSVREKVQFFLCGFHTVEGKAFENTMH